MPQMSPSWWTLLSMFEFMIFSILIMKIYFMSTNLKIYFPLKTFMQKKKINWKWN